jgi:hypothetical protein
VDGRVGEHEAQLGQAGRHSGGDGRACWRLRRPGRGPTPALLRRRGAPNPRPGRACPWPAGGEDDGAPQRGEGRLGLRAEVAQGPGLVHGGDHDREGLVVPGLAPAQFGHRRLVGRVAGQVVAPEPLDGQDPPVPEVGRRGHEGVLPLGPHLARRGLQRDVRPAHRAGVGLGVEAAVGRVLVLPPAVGTHGEGGHGGGRPVVGDGPDDRVAGPAVRAVDERVAEPAVGGVVELPPAVVARGHIHADRHRRGARHPAVHDAEGAGVATRRPARHVHRGDRGERGRLVHEPAAELVERGGVALDLGQHAEAVVGHLPG